MKSVKGILGNSSKKNIERKICKVCGADFENYDLYFGDEFKFRITDDICFDCTRNAEVEEMKKEAIRSRQRAKIRNAKNNSVIPYELEGIKFEDYEPKNQTQRNAYETSINFAKGELIKTTLFFQGDTGLGKTHLSYCIHQHFLNDNKTSIFIDLPSLLASIRNTYGNKNDYRAKTQEDIMRAINDVELFILDDIGAEYVKPDSNGYESWAADILFQIANSRQGKKNIYTTNFTSKQLTKKYGMMSKRIISRLMSNAKVIKIEGDDHRLKGLD